MLRHAANAVTGLRFALTPLFLAAVWRAAGGASGWPAGVLFAAIAASDFFDGRLARRFGAASQSGRVLDPAADIGFLLSALSLYAWLGLAPWWVPVAIAASVAAFALDALRRGGGAGGLGSRIGHFGGVMNFVVVGVLVYDQSVGLRWLPGWLLDALFGLVPLYSGTSILLRLVPPSLPTIPPLEKGGRGDVLR